MQCIRPERAEALSPGQRPGLYGVIHIRPVRAKGKHPTPMTIQLLLQCLLGIQGILRNWTFLIFKQV